jgi:hypothetical protein
LPKAAEIFENTLPPSKSGSRLTRGGVFSNICPDASIARLQRLRKIKHFGLSGAAQGEAAAGGWEGAASARLALVGSLARSPKERLPRLWGLSGLGECSHRLRPTEFSEWRQWLPAMHCQEILERRAEKGRRLGSGNARECFSQQFVCPPRAVPEGLRRFSPLSAGAGATNPTSR